MRPLRVYVAGPYSAPTEEEVCANVARAIDAALALYAKGHIPFVPHLTHQIEARARQLGTHVSWEEYVLRWDAPWLELCDALLLLRESPGSLQEVEMAERWGKLIFRGGPDVVPAAKDEATTDRAAR
ncbi:MAG: hypothetical protein ACRD11_06780 [Terriglobia bacterium]